MKISTKGRYALRLMVDLALNGKDRAIPLKEIASRQNISVKYLEQIINILNRSGYVKSTRGSLGGYRIAGSPSDYTVGMILRLTEGNIAPVSCLEDEINICPNKKDCTTLYVWEKLYESIKNTIDAITIEDIAVNYKSQNI
jgi:Rrf2 family protein